MKMRLFAVTGLTLVLTACGPGPGDTITEPVAAPAKSLSDIRKQAESNDVRTVQAPDVDAAAKNINPFKPGFDYKERDIYDRLLVQARADDTYLERSLALTSKNVTGLPGGVTAQAYSLAIECAAALDASAKKGLRPAHQAQDLATRFFFQPPIGTLFAYESEDLVLFEEDGDYIPLSEMESRASEIRKRSYLNYHLLRDRMVETKTDAELQAVSDKCVEDAPAAPPEPEQDL